MAINSGNSASTVPGGKRKYSRIALALLLGLAVGGMIVGGLVATANAQTSGAIQPWAKAQVNAHDTGPQDHIQAGRGAPCVPGTDDIVLISDSKTLSGLDTEQGTIEATGGYITTPLPLCINNGTLSSWYGLFSVYGGYTPYDGYINVWQKHTQIGTIYLSWKWVESPACCTDNWIVTFYVKQNFCLDSNQYPTLVGDAVVSPNGYTTIPGKAVDLCVFMYWRGCHQLDQSFLIIPAHRDPLVPEYLPLLSPLPSYMTIL